MKKKLLALALALTMALSLAACGGDSGSNADSTGRQRHGGALRRFRHRLQGGRHRPPDRRRRHLRHLRGQLRPDRRG